MDSSIRPGAAISHEDLAVLTELAMMRFPLRAAESQRLQRMQTLLEAATDLSRVLASHTHCALVNYRGTHGTGDLRAETDALTAALGRYAALLRDVATEYRHVAAGAAPAPEPRASEAGRPQLLAG